MAAGVSAPAIVDSRLPGEESFRFRHRQAVVVGIADPPSSNLNDRNRGLPTRATEPPTISGFDMHREGELVSMLTNSICHDV